jgi:uncharacterized protein YjdB
MIFFKKKNFLSAILSLAMIGSIVAVVSFTASADTSTPNVNCDIEYSAHVQSIGWQPFMIDHMEAGTTGKSLRLEAIKIQAGNEAKGTSVIYQTYVQGIGWQSAVSNGQISGTVGQGKRIQAIRITISGGLQTEIQYRVYIQKLGWTSWTSTLKDTPISGASILGETSAPLRIEAIEIIL